MKRLCSVLLVALATHAAVARPAAAQSAPGAPSESAAPGATETTQSTPDGTADGLPSIDAPPASPATPDRAPALTATADVADGPRPIGDVVALGVVSVGSLAGSIAMLVAASQTHSDYEATGTELLIEQERRQTLSQREDAQNILGYTLLGVSALSGAGFGVLLHRHLQDGRPDATITLAPSVGLRQVGVRLGARF